MKVELIFETKNGAKLYAKTWNGMVQSFHSKEGKAEEIIAALKEDAESKNTIAFEAAQLYGAVKVLSITEDLD